MSKKVILIALSLVLLFSGVTSANELSENDTTQKVVINEYQLLQQLKDKTDNELKEMSYTKEEIKEIRDADYTKHIRKLAKLDKNQLEDRGYNEAQVDIIKNFQGTEEEIVILSATLNFSATLMSANASTSESYVNFYIGWSWSTMPVWLKTDYIGVAWSDGFYTDIPLSYQNVRYVWVGTSLNDDYVRYDPIIAPGAGCSYKFDMIGDDIEIAFSWAKSGSGWTRAYYPGYKNSMEYRIAYGHTIITIVGAGVSITGTPSISFKGMTVEQDAVQGQWIN